jgi:NADPH:quinone reductase-like Zn-dependent oxidoreductase
MKGIVVDHWLATPSELQLKTLPDPTCPSDGVLIRVMAIGLNFFDNLMIRGYVPDFLPPTINFVNACI